MTYTLTFVPILVLKIIIIAFQQIVIKLQTKNEIGKYNSIITFWSMRKRSYNSIIKKNKKVFQNLDKNE